MPETSTVTSRIAGLSNGPQQVISGVAVGAGDVTRGLSGDQKVWTPEELKEAANSLEGGDLKALHSETSVGTVTDAGYVDGEGVVYEARVEDSELAEAIADGRLTVSVEARHSDGGTVKTDRGEAMRASEIEFSDLAIVQRGAAPSASAEPGEAATLEAALAPAAIHAALEDEEDPASTEGDASDIDISDQTETALENKVEEHNEEVDSGKEVTLGQLKKVYRRGAGAWFSSNKGATQSQWAFARVNEALSDIKSEKAINHGNDNDIFKDSLNYSPPEEEQSAALVDINGTEVDLEAPARVKNAIEAALSAKEEYGDEIGDCGTGVGEEMGQTILEDDLTPEIVTSGGNIAQYGPATYLNGHGDEGPATDDPPTDWGREEWLGITDGGSARCGPVQLAVWGYYSDWFENTKNEVEAAMEESEMAADVAIPMPSESVQLLYPEQSVAGDAARAMGLGDEEDADGDITHTHDFEGETWYMPGADHGSFVDVVSGMDAGMAGTAPVAKLNEYKAVGPIEFRGTRDGELDKSAISNDSDEYQSHYFNASDTKSESSFPLVDAEGYLRRGNLDAAWDQRGQGDLGMPRDPAERLMLNLGLVFGAPDSEANPLPQEAYDERSDVGTPYAEATALATVVDAVVRSVKPDDPEMGEDSAVTDTSGALTTMTNDSTQDAALGSYLANAMSGKMEEMTYREDMSYAEMMRNMASQCGMSESHLRSIRRGDTGCPSLDAIEAMSDVLDADMDMLIAAAERDGCEYSEASYDSGASSGRMTDTEDDENEDERMADDTTKELKASLADKNERIEQLENKVESLRAEREAVASEYAEALAGTDTVLDAETITDKFTVTELAEMYEDATDAALVDSDSEPIVRSGSDGSTPESESLSSSARERVAELEDELEQWERRDSRLAAVRTEEIESELADLRGDN